MTVSNKGIMNLTHAAEEVEHGFPRSSVVHRPTCAQESQPIEQVVDGIAWLVDGEDHCAAPLGNAEREESAAADST